MEEWASNVFEVEFVDQQGQTYALAALPAGQLMRLLHDPVHQAA